MDTLLVTIVVVGLTVIAVILWRDGSWEQRCHAREVALRNEFREKEGRLRVEFDRKEEELRRDIRERQDKFDSQVKSALQAIRNLTFLLSKTGRYDVNDLNDIDQIVINAARDVTFGGDLAGRDKITSTIQEKST